MTIRIAINGYGRIGRNILRALYESGTDDMTIVAINDLADVHANAHLTRYDTTHGRFGHDVSVDGEYLVIRNDRIRVCSERDPSKLPWGEMKVDVVLECTGLFASRAKASAHLAAGARKVLISAPAGKDVDATIVYGVNDDTLRGNETIVSNASCTTNCLAPLVKPLHEVFGIESGLMVTVHAYTNDQVLNDVYHKDLRRARAAAQSIIPTKTGAAAAIGLVLPALDGVLDGYAMRVPTLNVSIVDLTCIVNRDTTVDEVNQVLKQAADGTVAQYNEAPLVSTDFNHSSASSVFDLPLTKVHGRLVKTVSWYDNEWGFVNRMLDTTRAMMR